MICPKCAGLMVGEWVKDYWLPTWMARCLQCGTVLDQQIYQHRQLSRAKGVEMPKFLSEESKQEYINKCRAAKLERRKKENEEVIVIDDDGEQEEKPIPALEARRHAVSETSIPQLVNQHENVPSWRLQTILKLQDSRDALQQQLAEIETAIKAVKALA